MSLANRLNDCVSDRDNDARLAVLPGVYLAEVTKVDGQVLHFVVPEFAGDIPFETTRWPQPPARTGEEAGGGGEASFAGHSHDLRIPNDPPAGTEIAVAFFGKRAPQALVLTIYGWPT